ncbi:MAG: hypothetical protein ACKVP5_18700, partial [Aestuariivirga sp.]
MPHPLDPLTPAEISAASALIRAKGGLSARAWFETITLHEPEKADIASNPPRR